jgi:hypothetical protein
MFEGIVECTIDNIVDIRRGIDLNGGRGRSTMKRLTDFKVLLD